MIIDDWSLIIGLFDTYLLFEPYFQELILLDEPGRYQQYESIDGLAGGR
jgi:hypothetical protein